MKTRQEAKTMVDTHVKTNSLKKHCLCVATAMETYARKKGLVETEIDKWWMTGMLHDFDWEIHPNLEEHPREGVKMLREKGVDEAICTAILGHGTHTGVPRESDMAKTLFAVDELTGLIIALAHVRPGRLEGMSAKSIKKVMKKKDFAAAINRDDIQQGMKELGIEADEHFPIVIEALRGITGELGLETPR